MKILLLSRDASGLDPASATSTRWKLLRDQGVHLAIVVMQRSSGRWEDKGLFVIGGGGGFFSRMWRAYVLAKASVREADLISAQDPFELGFLAFCLAKKYKKKLEIQDHGGFFDGEKNDEPLWFLRKYLARFLVKRANIVRTVSPKSYAVLQEQGVHVYHQPIAVQDRFLSATYQPAQNHIVAVSRLIPVKRIAFLLQMFRIAKQSCHELRLTIVGDGPEKASLISLTQSLGIHDAVAFVGQTDPLPYLEQASLFVMTSLHEGWGVAAVEAASVGVPVLMTDTGCAHWLEERGLARLCVCEDPEVAAKELLATLKGSPAMRLHEPGMSTRSLARAQIQAWSQTCTISRTC